MTTDSPETQVPDESVIVIRVKCDCGRDLVTYLPPTAKEGKEEEVNGY
jgi:hypothetical protein